MWNNSKDKINLYSLISEKFCKYEFDFAWIYQWVTFDMGIWAPYQSSNIMMVFLEEFVSLEQPLLKGLSLIRVASPEGFVIKGQVA